MKLDVPFIWQDDHQHAFNELKKAISAESCLQYYNPRKTTILEVDASSKGLGACLLQEGNQLHLHQRASHRHRPTTQT